MAPPPAHESTKAGVAVGGRGRLVCDVRRPIDAITALQRGFHPWLAAYHASHRRAPTVRAHAADGRRE